jgi:hypothetical protein
MKIVYAALMLLIATSSTISFAEKCDAEAKQYGVKDYESLGFSCPNGDSKIDSRSEQGGVITYKLTVICNPADPRPIGDEVLVNSADCSLHL